jgi:hypothetical protein
MKLVDWLVYCWVLWLYIALFQLNTIWVSCEGESPADVENIGPIKYIPKRGFPGYFYPYKNSEGYLSPVMAIHFERPRSKPCNEYWHILEIIN